MPRWTLVTLAVVLGGCSATSGSGIADASADDAATPSTQDGGEGDNDAGAPSDGGSTGDASPADGGTGPARLYPVAVGYTWTYDVKAVGGGAVCATGSHDAKVLSGPKPVAGKQAFEVTSFCAAAGTSQIAPAPQGDRVDLLYNGGWLMFIDPDLTEGHSWQYFNSSYTWHKETSITVPAGTFSDCWTAKQNVTYTAFMTYCRGAGMVRSYSQDLAGNGWDAKLTKKSF